MSKPSVLFVVDGYYPALGGAELQVKTLTAGLKDRGQPVEVVAPQLSIDMPEHDEVEGIKVTRIPYPRIRVLGGLLLMLRFAAWVWGRRKDFDAIHIHMVKNLAFTLGILKVFYPDLNVIAKVSGAWEFDGGILDYQRQRKLCNRIMLYFIKKLDCFQSISQYTTQRLIEAGFDNEKVALLPNGVDLSKYPAVESAALPNVVTVLYAGRLENVKGVSVLIDAWITLVQSSPGVTLKLKMAGTGTLQEQLKNKLIKSGIEDTVEFLGYVKDLTGFYASGNIYVQPSFQEGLPNSVIEAMINQLPVVATDVSGNQDLIKSDVNGLLVKAGDVDGIFGALKRLVDSKELRRQLSSTSRSLIASDYGLDVVLDKLNDKYARRK